MLRRRPLRPSLVAASLIVSRILPTRQLLDEIDLPLLILFAINCAFAQTGFPEEAVRALASHDLLPSRVVLLAPISLVLGNTIAQHDRNVPAVVMILKVWQAIPQGTLVGLAILSTLAGNLFLVGSLANLIVAERASAPGVQPTFRDHARAGVPITLLSMLFAGLWLWIGGYMPLWEPT